MCELSFLDFFGLTVSLFYFFTSRPLLQAYTFGVAPDVLAVCLRLTPLPDITNIMAPPAQGRRGLIRGTTLFPERSVYLVMQVQAVLIVFTALAAIFTGIPEDRLSRL